MHFKPLAAFTAVLAASASVFAAEPVDVSPLVNDRTIAVGQIDLAQLKLRPAFDWAVNTAKRAGIAADMLAPMEQGAAALALIGQPSVDGLRRAGVSTLAVVVQLDENLTKGAPPILLLAVPKPADPQRVTAALAALGMRSGEKDNLMVFSPNLPPGVLAGMRPTDRTDLAVRMNDSAVAAAIGFSEPVKADLLAKQVAPTDPQAAAVIRDVKRTELRVDTAGGPHINLVAETVSPDAAAALKQQITMDRQDRDGRTWAAIAKTLPLNVDGASLVLSLRQPEIDAVIKAVVPAAGAARITAQQAQSMSNMRQLMIAAMLFANDHDGATPASLDELTQFLFSRTGKKTSETAAAALTTNPAKSELGASGYVYVRSIKSIKGARNLHTTVALYEAGEFGEGINVGFWDGHVERLTDEAKFKAMLDAATPAAPTTAP